MTQRSIGPASTREPLWPKVRAYLLWAISAAGAFLSFMMLHLSIWMVIEVLWPWDPLRQTAAWGGIRTTQILSIFVLGVAWIGWVIGMESYYLNAKSLSLLLKRFGIMTFVQVVIAVVYWSLPSLIAMMF